MGKIRCDDFETNNHAEDCRVWAWASCDLDSIPSVEIGNTIDSYIADVSKYDGRVYFHNLKFDGTFIMDWLFRNGYQYIKQEKVSTPYGRKLIPLERGQFTALISDMGAWYSLKVCWLNTGIETEFLDSLKCIPLSIEAIPKAFGLGESKGSIDYNAVREYGHELTEEEREYIKGDVIIAAQAMRYMIEQGNTKMTAASNALADFKRRYGLKKFNHDFPKLTKPYDDTGRTIDEMLRSSYKGGWTYLNPKYADKPTGSGLVYDVNSMYPWAMKYCLLPYGMPIFEPGAPKKKTKYPLYVTQFVCTIEGLKPNHYPSLQLKGCSFFAENEYITESALPIGLTLTSVDFELFKENYNYTITEWIGTMYFRGKKGIFSDYIDYWYNVKTEAKKSGNSGMQTIAKLMLNSLYGKFGAKIKGRSKIPWYDKEAKIIRWKYSEVENREGVYIPIASFITSYCRDKIIRAANAIYDRFVYADTDSLHILGDEAANEIDIDEYRLGAFKEEMKFNRARYIRQKTYLEITESYYRDENGVLQKRTEQTLKCAGMPQKMKDSVTEKDFYYGAEFPPDKFAPKLSPKIVPGGVILREMGFKIH